VIFSQGGGVPPPYHHPMAMYGPPKWGFKIHYSLTFKKAFLNNNNKAEGKPYRLLRACG
jgi:hypothetical protein